MRFAPASSIARAAARTLDSTGRLHAHLGTHGRAHDLDVAGARPTRTNPVEVLTKAAPAPTTSALARAIPGSSRCPSQG